MENFNLEELELERKTIKRKNTIAILIGVGVFILSIILAFATEFISIPLKR